jgi:hypothetical protein
MHTQYQHVIERFHADEAFRQAVLADANGAVKQEFGIDLPGQVRVVSDGEGYRVEPVMGAGGDLSDDQLDLVAGGAGKGGSVPRPVSPIRTSSGIVAGNTSRLIQDGGAY